METSLAAGWIEVGVYGITRQEFGEAIAMKGAGHSRTVSFGEAHPHSKRNQNYTRGLAHQRQIPRNANHWYWYQAGLE
jgi:hypothetical protein